MNWKVLDPESKNKQMELNIKLRYTAEIPSYQNYVYVNML